MTTTVTGTAVDASGQALANVDVIIRLVTDLTKLAPGYAGTQTIVTDHLLLTDASGVWTTALVPNASITPANTVYQAIVRADRGSVVTTFSVPSSGGPYNVASILAPVPGALTPPGSATQADIALLQSEINALGGGGGGGGQPLDSDLTTIAAIDSSVAGVLVTDGAGWIRKTYAQLKTTLGLVKADVGLGNVDNTSDASKPISTLQQAALDLKAPLASPALTGTPTAPTAAAGTNTTQVATTAFTQTAIANLVNSAPGTLDTLGEIAAALSADESTAAALATTVGTKAPLASPALTGNPTAPTQAAGDNSTKLATTAYADAAAAARANALIVTTVKTANYTAAANEFARFDTTTGALVLTLPAAPANRTRIGGKVVLGANTLTVNTGGTDTFNRTGGATTLTLLLLGQSFIAEYSTSDGTWTISAVDIPLTQLDARYVTLSTVTAAGDLIVGSGVGSVARLAKGTALQQLRVNSGGTALEWFTASGGSGAVTQIATSTLAAPAASFDFTSIPGTYTSLMLEFAVSSSAGAADILGLRLNNDSTATNYITQVVISTNGGNTASNSYNNTVSYLRVSELTDTTSGTGSVSTGRIIVPAYALTTFHKLVLADTARREGSSFGGLQRGAMSGQWLTTSAITRLTLIPVTGPNFVTGSTVTLWGVT